MKLLLFADVQYVYGNMVTLRFDITVERNMTSVNDTATRTCVSNIVVFPNRWTVREKLLLQNFLIMMFFLANSSSR